MPFQVDEEKMQDLKVLDIGNPPLKQIPYLPFPKMVYKHPKRPFRTETRVDAQGKTFDVQIALEHRGKIVADDKELAKALKEGWVKEPYLPQAPPTATDDLY